MKSLSTKKIIIAILSVLFAFCMMAGLTANKVSANTNLETVTLKTTMDQSAQMRLTNPTGMRFITVVEQEDVDKFNYDNITVVTMITQKNLLDDANIEVADFNKDSAVKMATVEFNKYNLADAMTVHGSYKLTATILEISDSNIAKTYIAKTYITDGEKIGYVGGATEASIYDVATEALKNVNPAEEPENYEVLLGYTKSCVITVNGQEMGKVAYNGKLSDFKFDVPKCYAIASIKSDGVDVDLNANVITDLDLTVEFTYNHSYVDGACEFCEAPCCHPEYEDGTCVDCGMTVEEILASSLTEGYLADYSDVLYEELVYTPSLNSAATVEATYLPTFGFKEGVLQVDATVSDSGCASFGLNLAKQSSTGVVSLRIYVKDKVAPGFCIMNTSEDGNALQMSWDTPVNHWFIVKVDLGQAIDKIGFNLWACEVGSIYTVYVDAVYDHDELQNSKNQLASKLDDGCLADYSSEAYSELLYRPVVGAASGAKSFDTTYLTSFKGQVGVLKVTSIADGTNAHFDVLLPKVSTTDKLTIRFYLETEKTAGFTVEPDGVAATNWTYDSSITTGKWITTTINSRVGVDKIRFNMWADADVETIYFDAIYDGEVDITQVYADKLEASLEVGYLADYSSALYESMVRPNTNNGDAYVAEIETEYLAEYKGEKNVLKITSTLNAQNCADFILKLPKGRTGNGVTFRYIFGEESCEPAGFMVLNVDKTRTYFPVWPTLSKTGWQEMYVDLTSDNDGETQTTTDELGFGIWQGTVGEKVVMYLSFVYDGQINS